MRLSAREDAGINNFHRGKCSGSKTAKRKQRLQNPGAAKEATVQEKTKDANGNKTSHHKLNEKLKRDWHRSNGETKRDQNGIVNGMHHCTRLFLHWDLLRSGNGAAETPVRGNRHILPWCPNLLPDGKMTRNAPLPWSFVILAPLKLILQILLTWALQHFFQEIRTRSQRRFNKWLLAVESDPISDTKASEKGRKRGGKPKWGVTPRKHKKDIIRPAATYTFLFVRQHECWIKWIGAM